MCQPYTPMFGLSEAGKNAIMTEEAMKRRVPLVPGPRAGLGFQQERPKAEQESPQYVRDKLDRDRELEVAGLRAIGAPAHISVTHPPLLNEKLPPIGNIAKAIAGVMREVGDIEKRGMNKFHNYAYMTIGDMCHVLTPLIGKHGLAIIMNEVERNIVESRVAVTYEFSIIHESGERWPERPRHTGMAIARDSKGNWDDKAFNKCHTAARKYFLLGLFQVPAGDFDDADADKGTDEKEPPVPGPGAPIIDQGDKPARAQQWADDFIERTKTAKNREELAKLEVTFDRYLQSMSEKYPEIYARISAAVQSRFDDLRAAAELAMPADNQHAMNWIAEHLNAFKTYEAAEKFWNDIVEPQRMRFDVVDWELLLSEWTRTEARFGYADVVAPPPGENNGDQQHPG